MDKSDHDINDAGSSYESLFDIVTSSISVFEVITNDSGKPADYKFISVNKAYENTIGYKNFDLLGKTLLEVYPRTEKVWLDAIEKVYLSGTPITLEEYSQEVDMFFELVIYRPKSNTIALIGTDITKRKQSEKRLIENEEKYRSIVEGLNEAIYRMRLPDGIYEYFSPAVSKVFGYNVEDFLENPLLIKKIIHSDFNEYFEEKFKDLLKGEVALTYEYKIIDPSGKQGWIYQSNKGIFNNKGKIIAIEGLCRDITKQKDAEEGIIRAKEEAEERELFLKVSQEIGKIGSFKLNMDTGNFISTETLNTLLGIPANFQKNITNWFDIIHPEDRSNVEDYFRNEVIINKKNFNKEYRIIRKSDNETRWIHSLGNLLFDDKGEITYMIGTVQDITNQKNYEQQILERNNEYESLNEELRQVNEELLLAKEKAEQANKLKTEFLNNMSHEVRTPMNGIVGFAEMLDDEDVSDERKRYFTKIIRNSSHQLLRIINDILEISAIETKQQRVREDAFCLNDLLMELFSIYELKSKDYNIPLYIKKSLKDDQSYILSDRTKLSRILDNLIENALKYTSSGFVEVGSSIENDKLIIYVKDTGIGISPKNFDMIFERFSQEDKDFSRKHGGLGLGLSISKENARLLGGDISLESRKGKGSTFFITLPYKPQIKGDIDSYDMPYPPSNVNKEITVLIVEDEEVNQFFMETILNNQKDINFKIIFAKNEKDAVDHCLNNRSIDVVLMDIKMPVMNGYEATKKIREVLPDITIIAQTAYSTPQDKENAFKSGCNEFISKPLEKEKLIALIKKYVKK